MQPESRRDVEAEPHPEAFRNIQNIVAVNQATLLRIMRDYRAQRPTGDLMKLSIEEQSELISEIRTVTNAEGDAYLLELQKTCQEPSEYENWARCTPRLFGNVARQRWLRLTDGMAFQCATSLYDAEVETLSYKAELYVLNDLRERVEARTLETWERHANALAVGERPAEDPAVSVTAMSNVTESAEYSPDF